MGPGFFREIWLVQVSRTIPIKVERHQGQGYNELDICLHDRSTYSPKLVLLASRSLWEISVARISNRLTKSHLVTEYLLASATCSVASLLGTVLTSKVLADGEAGFQQITSLCSEVQLPCRWSPGDGKHRTELASTRNLAKIYADFPERLRNLKKMERQLQW